MKRILVIICLCLLALVLLLPVIGFAVLKWGILPPEKLTPLVEREANKLINGQLRCEKAEMTFFETYPYLGVRLTEGSLLSFATGETDTLLSFHQAVASVQLMAYLSTQTLTIREILVERPDFYGYVDETGLANWDIYQDGSEDTDTTSFPVIDVRRIRIEDGHLRYKDDAAGIFTEIEGFSLRLTGSLLKEGGNTFEVETESSAFTIESPLYSIRNKLSLQLKSTIELRDNFNTVTLHNAEMRINDIPFAADGSVTNLPETKSLGINLEASLKASDLNEILSLIPDTYFTNRDDIQATGAITVQGQMLGELGDSVIPTIDLCCIVEEGSLFMKDVRQGIEIFDMDIDLHIDGAYPEASYASIAKLEMKGLNSSLNVHGEVKNILQSPVIDACIKGDVDFTRLAGEFLHPDTLLLQGNIKTDIDAVFSVEDLMNGHYNRIRATGMLDIDSLIAFSKPYDMNLFIRDVHLSADLSRSDRSVEGTELLGAELRVDSMSIRYKDEINTHIKRLAMTARTLAARDTSAFVPITSHLQIERLRTRLPDSTWVIAKQASLQGGLGPSASDRHRPILEASIHIDTLRYFATPIRTGLTFAGSSFDIQALPYRDALRQRFSALRSDSTRRINAGRNSGTEQQADGRRIARRNRQTPADSLARHNRRQPSADSLSLSESQQMLRNWEVRGSLSFRQMRLTSRLFPLPMRMEATQLKFDTNTLTLSDARFHAGKSDFTLSGEINNLRRTLLRGGKLRGNLRLSSELIDCNQLISAMARGMQYSEEKMTKAEQTIINEGDLTGLAAITLHDSIPSPAAADSAGLLILPDFLDISFNLNARKIDYKDLKMENVEGEVVVRNQSINLKKLEMQSNIGQGNLTMFYTADNTHEATAGFELEMRGMLVDKLIQLYPSVDSLLPMLRSFEGVVDCQLVATCGIDSSMSVILPSLNTACFLRGKDMVLLDGETFAEISKTLMFKNKLRNRIDSISVDLAIRNNKIEVFPFLLEMDRYRVAVGGMHNFDMTFDYHLSVLKSPVPFNLGIDITGNLDKFRYKIVKCRYKDSFNPTKEESLITTKTNIREGLRELIRRQIVENAPELALRQPSSVLRDSVSLSYNP
ncbi:MAG: AsmA family protein [Tannerellaceae bacterium]|jgi:hypothetical protein|nr:AsmA family protein [Tannerellaceae bacterium]